MKFTASQKKIHPFASVWYKIGLFWAMITYHKSAWMLLCKYCAKRYGLGLSNEQFFIIIALGAAKLWPVKFGVLKNTNFGCKSWTYIIVFDTIQYKMGQEKTTWKRKKC